MNNRKKMLIGAAVTGILSVGLASGIQAADKTMDDNTMGKCYGPNACKMDANGKHKCGKNSCPANSTEMTKKECDDLNNARAKKDKKEKKQYHFEKNPESPDKQNKAESTQKEQTDEASVTDESVSNSVSDSQEE